MTAYKPEVIKTSETIRRFVIYDPTSRKYYTKRAFEITQGIFWTPYINNARQFLTRDQASRFIRDSHFDDCVVKSLTATYTVE